MKHIYKILFLFLFLVSIQEIKAQCGSYNVTADSITNLKCFNDSSGAVRLHIASTNPNFRILVDSGTLFSRTVITSDTLVRIGRLRAGNHSIIVIDSFGCRDTINFLLTETFFDVTIDSIVNYRCYNSTNTGSFRINIFSTFPRYTIYINSTTPTLVTGSSTVIRSGLATGTYRVVVVDSMGCKDSLNVTITAPTRISPTVSVVNIAYTGGTGSATIIPTGGTPGYTYALNGYRPYQSSSFFGTMPIGNYVGVVRDTNGCFDTINFSVARACSQVPFNITDRDSICNGTCATILTSLPVLKKTTSYTLAAIPYEATLPCEGSGISAPGSIRLDDIHSLAVPIGFDFCFFGNTYNQCVMSANCYVTFNAALSGLFSPWAFGAGAAIPSAGIPEIRNSILAPYHDIDPSVGYTPTYVTYQTVGVAPFRAFIVKYTNIPMFSCNTLRHTSKIIMYETTNIIDIVITNKPICATWNGGRAIEGIQNATGTVGYAVPGRNATVWAAVNDAWRFTPNGQNIRVDIYWYPVDTPRAPIALNDTAYICPTLSGPLPRTIGYYARAVILDSCTLSATRVDSISLYDTTNIFVIGAYVTPVMREDTIRCSQDSLRLDGGTGGLQYSWLPIPLPPNLTRYRTVTSSGVYTCLKFTDIDRCYLDSVAIHVRDAPPLKDSIILLSPVRCRGDSSGFIVLKPFFNTGRVRYGLDGAVPTFGDTIRRIWAGPHYVIALDSFDCRDSIYFNMIESPSVIITLDTIINLRCNSDSSGYISVSVSGGAPPYTYIWNGSIDTNFISNIPAGQYSIVVIDNNVCAASDTFIVTEPTPLFIDSILADSVLCFGTNTGSARVFPSGGTPSSLGYAYSWSNSSTIYNPTNLVSQNYFVTVTDSNLCTIVDTINVPQPNILKVNILGFTPITCNNSNDGALILSGSGGSPSYEYSLDGITYSSTTILSGFSSGSQTVRIRDFHGCIDDSVYVFANPLRILPVVAGIRDESCIGANDGYVIITPTNGSPGYRYSKDNIIYQVSNQLNAYAQGTYTAYVKDTNNCIDSVVFTIGRVAPLVLVLDSSNVTCNRGNDGSIQATIFGGTPTYRYSLNGAPFVYSNIFTSLTQGLYRVEIRDTNNCIIRDSILVNQPLRIAPTVRTYNVSCFNYNNGSVRIIPTNGFGPYSFAVDSLVFDINDSIIGISPGTHMAYVRDRFLCIDSISFNITQPSGVVITPTMVRNVSCFGGNNGVIRINVTSGTAPYTYLWSSSSTYDSASVLNAGTYIVTVTDFNGCALSDTFVITQPTVLSGTMSRLNILCYGANTGSATIAPSGGTIPYAYIWNDALAQTTATATNLVARSYTVTLSDALGCRFIDSITLTQPDSILLSKTSRNIRCFSGNDGQIVGSAVGGVAPYQYNIGGAWQSSGTFNSLVAGVYTLTVRDFNGCTTNTSITLTQPLRIIPTILVNTPPLCNGGNDGSMQIGTTNGTAPFQYSLNNISYQVSNTLSGLSAGNYRAYVQDSLGCIDSINFTITEPAPIVIDVVTTQNKCNNDATGVITLSPRGGRTPYDYSIDGGTSFVGTNTFAGLVAGVYNIVVRDRNNCTASATTTLNNPTLFTIDASGVDVLCWDSDNGKINILPNGGTTPYQSYGISQNNVVFSTSNVPKFANLTSGFYYVEGYDANGCRATDTASIGRPPVDTFAFDIDSTSCYGAQYLDGSIIVSALANPPYTWTIDGGASQNFGIFYGLGAGYHLIIATNANGCVDSLIQFVPFPPPVIVDVVPDTVYLELGASQQINVNVQNAINPTYVWNTLQGLSCNDCPNPIVSPFNDMIYTIRVYDHSHPLNSSECYGEATLYVMVEEHIKSYVPNAFTPANTDGINDQLMVYGEGIKKLHFTIYDRWGELLFESNRQDIGWDGSYKGKILGPGVYIYYVEAEYLDSKKEYYQGSVTLLK
jgi:gliding motility-associated-like protein